ncbi:MAG: hypothetical protein K2J63_13470 [Muribaculaceae bacterium]|nr:hypothetical protein [Muribaculaceae bacterium]
MRIFRISIILIMFTLVSLQKVRADEDIPKFHSHNFYCHVEMNCGNIYPFAGWSILSGVLNSALHYNLFESGFAYDFYTGDGVKTKYNSPIAFSAINLFNHIQPGVKLGYTSDYINSSANWGILATLGYKINQFRMLETPDYINQCVHRLQLGGILLLAFGKNGGETQALIELGAKYNIATQYKSATINDSKALNNGWTSHAALKFGGKGWLQNIGVFVDIDHYKLFNKSFEYNGSKPFYKNNLRNTTIGVCVTVTPSQSEVRKRGY